jgi:hypothetical protein
MLFFVPRGPPLSMTGHKKTFRGTLRCNIFLALQLIHW